MTLKSIKRVFSDFSRFQAMTHIAAVDCAEINGDRPGKPAHKVCRIKRTF